MNTRHASKIESIGSKTRERIFVIMLNRIRGKDAYFRPAVYTSGRDSCSGATLTIITGISWGIT